MAAEEQHAVAVSKIASFAEECKMEARKEFHGRAVAADYGKLLDNPELADVIFSVDGERIPAHRCVLAARSTHFEEMFRLGQDSGIREGGRRQVLLAAVEDVVIKDVRALTFRVLLRYLYTGRLPVKGSLEGPNVTVLEMAKVASDFKAHELYEHCVERFRQELRVENVLNWLVQTHDNGLHALEAAAMCFLKENALAFQVRWRRAECHILYPEVFL